MGDFSNVMGRLQADASNRAGGKKVFDWTFFTTGTKESIPVSVYLEQNESGMFFRARCSRIENSVKDTDINRLHATVEALLLEQTSSFSQIIWEDWFEVVVKGENSDFSDRKYSTLGADLHIQVNRLKRGIHPVSGEPVTINQNKIVVKFPDSTELKDEPEKVSGIQFCSASGNSYIPATAANEAALRDILNRMELLRNSLAEVLSQGKVSESLSKIDSSVFLLG